METEFARTFLTVVSAGNFVKAAAYLHVTQSTVSARIRALEEYLGCRLFVRNKAGTTLTPAGREFQRHASALIRTLEKARQTVGVPAGFGGTLTIGGRFGLWERLLLECLPRMRQTAPDISVRAEIGFEADLMQRLVEGTMDIGVMYTPQNRPGLTVEPLIEDQLVLVGHAADDDPPPYIHVDWGPEFFDKHQTHFPEFHPPGLIVDIGWLGLQHILSHGGTGYFPERLVHHHVRDGSLFLIAGAPPFTLPAYMVYPSEHDPDVVDPALDCIRQIAKTPLPT